MRLNEKQNWIFFWSLYMLHKMFHCFKKYCRLSFSHLDVIGSNFQVGSQQVVCRQVHFNYKCQLVWTAWSFLKNSLSLLFLKLLIFDWFVASKIQFNTYLCHVINPKRHSFPTVLFFSIKEGFFFPRTVHIILSQCQLEKKLSG